MAVLEIENLEKSYRRGGETLEAVKQISFAAYAGEIVGVLGPNGSGKTTTLKSIAGLVAIDNGAIKVNGFDYKRDKQSMLLQLGAVLEGARNIYWRMSAWENIIYFAGLKGVNKNTAKQRATELLELLNLTGKKDDEVRSLSKGMQQKVAIACAVIHQPALILLDEPTLGLDVETTRLIGPWLKQLCVDTNCALIITSHDLDFIESVCDRVIIINKGQKIAESSVQELRAHYNPHKTINLTIQGELVEQAEHCLKAQLPWQIQAHTTHTTLQVKTDNLNLLYSAFACLQNYECQLIDISVLEDSLEDLFLQLTGSTNDDN